MWMDKGTQAPGGLRLRGLGASEGRGGEGKGGEGGRGWGDGTDGGLGDWGIED